MAYNMYLHRLCVVEYCILYTESLKSALQMVLLCATSYMLDLSRVPYYLPNVVYRMSSARVATSRLGQCANRAPEYEATGPGNSYNGNTAFISSVSYSVRREVTREPIVQLVRGHT